MRIKSLMLTIVIAAFVCNPCLADPADSLVKIIKWQHQDGGNGHTYALLKMTITWDSARVIVPNLTMVSMSGYLATITSQEENDFILNNVVNGAGVQPVIAQQFFLGGEEQSSIWSWLNGEPFNFTNWAPGEPNNVGIETVLSMWGFEESGQPAGKWNNTLPNLEVNPYIIQWSVVEWDEPDTSQSSADSLVKITKWEKSDGGNGHTYAILKQILIWDSANVLVPTLVRFGEPGYLASITSQEENDFIQFQLLEGMPRQTSLVDQYFTGGIYVNNEWFWQTGEPFDYTNWAPTEPNNIGIEIATSIWGYGETDSRRPAGKWNNTVPNQNVNPYGIQWSVVEWDEPDTSQSAADSLVKITKWEKSDGGNGHTYAILKQILIWDSANVLVPALVRFGEPGYLASITSQEENDFIQFQLLEGMPRQTSIADQYFTGGIYVNNEWFWQTGEPFDYTNWAPPEPNNIGIEIVTSIWGYGETDPRRPAGRWNNTLPNHNVNPYIHQWSVVEWDEPELLNIAIEPDELNASDSKRRDSAIVSIYLMQFLTPYTSNDIDQNSLLINGHLAPFNVSATTAFGDAIKVEVLLHDFLKDYVILWDTTTLGYTIEGSFNDNTPFNIAGSFQIIGHNPRDSNPHSNVSVAELTVFINMLFRGKSAPGRLDAFDFDGSCGVPNIRDLRYLINFLFRGGPPPLPGCTEE